MPCFFCNSATHLSQNCDIYVGKKVRQKLAQSKNCCHHCLYPRLYCIDENDVIDNNLLCSKCFLNRRCLLCFSKTHHTYFCSKKTAASFVPNINNDLISRYIKTLDLPEKYTLAFLNPTVFRVAALEPICVIDSTKIDTSNVDKFVKYNILVAPKFIARNNNYYSRQIIEGLDPIITKMTLYKPIEIILHSCAISAALFLELISTNTKNLKCTDIRVTDGKISFSDFIKRIPNIEFIEFNQFYDMEMENSWSENLLKWKKGNNLKKITMPIDKFDFCVKSLADIIEKTCAKICLNVENCGYQGFKDRQRDLRKKLSSHFIEIFSNKNNIIPCLTVFIENYFQSKFLNYHYFVLRE